MMEAVRYSMLGVFGLLWALFTYSDYRWNKIRNRSVLGGLLLGLLAYGVLALWTWRAEGRYFYWGFYSMALTHVCAAWAVAVGFWLLKIWPAGDAKLFAMIAVLFPLLDPLNGYLPYRVVLIQLMNVFIPAAVFIILGGFHWMWKTRVVKRIAVAREMGPRRWLAEQRGRLRTAVVAEAAARLREALREAVRRPLALAWKAADWLSFFAAAGLLMTVLLDRYGQTPWLGFALCGFSFLVWRALGVLRWARPVAVWAAVIMYLRLHPEIPVDDFVSRAAHFMAFGVTFGMGMKAALSWVKGGRALWWAWMAVPMLLGVFGPLLHLAWPMIAFAVFLGAGMAAVTLNVKEDTWDWKAENLQAYMVLSPESVEIIREDEEFYEEYFSVRYPDGLTREQAAALKDWCADNSVGSLSMQRTLSFAFWIFTGFALTIWLKQDLLHALLRL
ncbi:MAG: hypothetical protein ABII00_00165 [Elusimicrobiota bacterium]